MPFATELTATTNTRKMAVPSMLPAMTDPRPDAARAKSKWRARVNPNSCSHLLGHEGVFDAPGSQTATGWASTFHGEPSAWANITG